MQTSSDCDPETTPEIYGKECSTLNFMNGFLTAQDQFQEFPDVNFDDSVNVLDVVSVVRAV